MFSSLEVWPFLLGGTLSGYGQFCLLSGCGSNLFYFGGYLLKCFCDGMIWSFGSEEVFSPASKYVAGAGYESNDGQLVGFKFHRVSF